MMTIEEKIKMYKGKKAFVDNVSKAFQAASTKTGVLAVDYEVYCKEISPDFTHFAEYLVVTFVGGGKSVRNANGNSCNANFCEIGKLINGGYYDEVRDYEALINNGFTKVEV
jgi:hypothetical protein